MVLRRSIAIVFLLENLYSVSVVSYNLAIFDGRLGQNRKELTTTGAAI